MRIVVTGGAGFIGSNLVDRLLQDGHEAVVVDNLSTGDERFLAGASSHPGFSLHRIDLHAEPERLTEVVAGADAVVHLAANADVRFGWDNPRRDLEQNLIATHNVCEAMRRTGVRRLLFSSTGSVYGECPVIPTPEHAPIPVQTSLYGASKFAAEAFIQAYAEGGQLDATVFRFVSIMGERYTHGHVVDFMRKLRTDPTRLDILGDGKQRKSYLAVTDCVDAIVARMVETPHFETFNLGVDAYCEVADSARWICERLGLEPEFVFSGGDRGWVGDNPFIWLDTTAIRATGWQPALTIREAVEVTVDYLRDNEWVLTREEFRA